MMRFFLIIICFFLTSCSKQNSELAYPDEVVPEKMYDTIALDSFSNGAISVDVAEQIRMSSKKYRDSVIAERVRREEELKKKEEEAKLEKLVKETAEKEKSAEKDKAKTEQLKASEKPSNTDQNQ